MKALLLVENRSLPLSVAYSQRVIFVCKLQLLHAVYFEDLLIRHY